jgi:hypothetical protein
MISNRVEDHGTRFFGKIVLIKKKIPLIWSGKDFVKDGLPADDVENTKKGFKKRFNKNVGIKKAYPVPEEESFIPSDDDSAEIKYIIRKNKA